MKIEIIDRALMIDLCVGNSNADVSFFTVFNSDKLADRYYIASRHGEDIHSRTNMAIGYVDFLLDRLEQMGGAVVLESLPVATIMSFLFQADDTPKNVRSVSWETMADWHDIALVPDLYYYQAGGYADYMCTEDQCLNWEERAPVAVWRGATTGLQNMTLAMLTDLPRYNLCLAAKTLGPSADVGFTDIVQAASPEEHESIQRQLLVDGVVKPYLAFDEMSKFKYIVDIDGNANSWNFVKKLRLGGCILKVDGPWRQWFSDRLTPWRHYIPIEHDSADLAEKLDWCVSHDAEAREVAREGRAFALSLDFNVEVRRAAMRAIVSSAPYGA